MELKLGARYRSVVCDTEVIVVRAHDVDLACGGRPVTSESPPVPREEADPDLSGGTLLGKRYTDGAGLEVLVVKAGRGTLSVGPTPLEPVASKALPSSD